MADEAGTTTMRGDASGAPATRGARRTGLGPGPLGVVALAVGIADGLVFLGFEWLVTHGTGWLWNDLAGSDEARWRVVPLAVVLSVALSALLRALGRPRWVAPHLDPLGSADARAEERPRAPDLSALAVILVAGVAGLIAGASLGPEAPLVALATGLGAWAGSRSGAAGAGRIVATASAGALLVAFFGSLIALAIPVLIVARGTRRLSAAAGIAIVLAGLGAWATLWVVHGDDHGYGGIPAAPVNARDYPAAVLLGVAAAGLGTLLRAFVGRSAAVTRRVDERTPWWLAAAVFGGVLGALYLLGGRTVQFSGREGIGMLLGGDVRYGAWTLLGLALLKLVATSWSVTAGYRGGLVFPSVYAGVAVSLAATAVAPDLAGPGILLGGVAGLLVEMTAPALGAIMLLALLPMKLVPLGIAGAVGAIAGRAALTRVGLDRAAAAR